MGAERHLRFDSLDYLVWESDWKAGLAPRPPVTEEELNKFNRGENYSD